jgi:alpha-tubulin suppressor-like RCC1 family protein
MNCIGRATLRLVAVATVAACSVAPIAEDVSVHPVGSGKTTPQDDGVKKTGPRLYEFGSEPVGPNCRTGGQVLMAGVDANNNGVLDPGEVVSRSYVCNGLDGRTPVLSMRGEPIGTACPTGGQAISWGYDDNGNTVLDGIEVKQTSYVCNGQNGQNGQNGHTSLVTVLPQAPNQYCATGGQGIYTGIDLDGDGLLEPTEVKATSFVCNGASGQNGASALVRTTGEAAGPNCANGGLRVLSGLDTDGDRALADGEITDTSYVCNGAAGAPGPVGPQGPQGAAAIATRVNMAPEPAGPSCAAGGQRIDIGPDTNANGLLDATEIAQTRYVCNGAGGAAAGPVLSRQTALPVDSTTCPLGGTLVSAGFDLSGDGVLEDPEVTSSVAVCVRSRAAATNTCVAPQFALELGVDSNINGVLDAAEVTSTACGVPAFRSIDAAPTHTCSVLLDGTARCWGDNDAGQLGDGTNVQRTAPTVVVGGWTDGVLDTGPLSGVASIAADGYRTCAVMRDGSARCWGNGWEPLDPRRAPSKVAGLAGVVSIAPAAQHTCALLTDGSVRCWGLNDHGQLGAATPTPPDAITVVSGLSGVAAISAGGGHTCALSTDNSVRCWGDNTYGAIGDGSRVDRLTPSPASLLSGVASISAGLWHTCAALLNGSARCWGLNEDGQLGTGTIAGSSSPTAVLFLSQVTSISAGEKHTCAVSSGGAAHCWGANFTGQGGSVPLSMQPAPKPVSGLAEGADTISVGTLHTCALSTYGSAYCWGYNGEGELGVGSLTTSFSVTPLKVASP